MNVPIVSIETYIVLESTIAPSRKKLYPNVSALYLTNIFTQGLAHHFAHVSIHWPLTLKHFLTKVTVATPRQGRYANPYLGDFFKLRSRRCWRAPLFWRIRNINSFDMFLLI